MTIQEKDRRRTEYNLYLKSDAWRSFRKVALAHANYKCSDCGSKDNLEVHHEHYKTFGFEKLSDVKVLCRECHKQRHTYKNKSTRRKKHSAFKYPILSQKPVTFYPKRHAR